MYHMDFFGKGNASPLDTIIELGKSGYNNLLAKNNVDAYSISLANNNATKICLARLPITEKFYQTKQIINGSKSKPRLISLKKNQLLMR